MHSTLLAVLALALPVPVQDAAAPAALPPPRTVAECGAKITALSVDAASTTVVVATDAGELRAFDLDKDKPLWTLAGDVEGVPATERVRVLAVGSKHVLWAGGAPAPSSVELKKGTDPQQYMMLGMGPGNTLLKLVGMTCDPKDRWAWLALREGVVVRYTPGSKSSYNRRAVEGATITAIATDGDQVVAIGCEDGSIRFVNASSTDVDEKKVLREHTVAVTALAFAGKGGALVSGDQDGAVHVWNVATGKSKSKLAAATTAVRAIVAHPKGKWAVTGDAGGNVRIWSLDKGHEIAAFPAGEGKPVVGLALVDGGKSIAVARGGTSVQVFDVSKL